jgi:hypothetical protein
MGKYVLTPEDLEQLAEQQKLSRKALLTALGYLDVYRYISKEDEGYQANKPAIEQLKAGLVPAGFFCVQEVFWLGFETLVVRVYAHNCDEQDVFTYGLTAMMPKLGKGLEPNVPHQFIKLDPDSSTRIDFSFDVSMYGNEHVSNQEIVIRVFSNFEGEVVIKVTAPYKTLRP